MSPPPLFLATCAALWAVQTGQWVVGGLLAVLLESHHLVKMRWDLGTDDFRKLATLCNVILLLVLAWFLTTLSPRSTLPRVLQWWPLILLPLVVAAHYSVSGKVSLAALFMLLRRRAKEEGRQPRSIHLGYPFAVAMVLAAAGSNVRDGFYYATVCLLAAWALWFVRAGRHSVLPWAGMLASVAGLGFAAHLGLNQFQHWLVDTAVDLLSGSRTDPYRHTTDIGHIGTLKLSDRILMRVETEQPLDRPLLLHRATYNTYIEQTWVATRSPLETIQPPADLSRWLLADPGAIDRSPVTISTVLERGVGVLALPPGTVSMDNPYLVEMQRNRLGTFRATGDAVLMRYTVGRSSAVSLPKAPRDDDLRLPAGETRLLEGIAARLGLAQMPVAEAMDRVDRYFDEGFEYSLYQEGDRAEISPLADFLTRTRAGHCEYFATATTLVLRAAGIPARYATGFSVQEYSPLERAYLVRLRHAHSWVRVWVDGRWQDLDTTPPVWFALESGEASILEPVVDLLSWLWHQFSLWQMNPDRGGQQWVLLLALPVIGYLVWRLRGQRRRLQDQEPDLPEFIHGLGRDSGLFSLLDRLRARGLGPRPGESSLTWARRLAETDARFEGLEALVQAHYRHRFSAQAASPGTLAAVETAARPWLSRI